MTFYKYRSKLLHCYKDTTMLFKNVYKFNCDYQLKMFK
jgi:hypothetical protein